MKKYYLLIALPFLIVSCSFPNYIFENQAQSTGVDFTIGKWLLNDVDAPPEVEDQLSELVEKDFKNFLNDRLTQVSEARGLLLPRKININPSKKDLDDLKKGSQFDFFINVKASHNKQEFGALDITPHTLNQGGTNQSQVILEVYDLNLGQIIYSQRVIGSIDKPVDNQDVHISKPSSSLLIGAYKKLIKDIKNKSIK